jgi:hypothetical protein
MPDWTQPMAQTFEYCEVDPVTWKDKRKIHNVRSCTIDRNDDSETLGSATIDVDDILGEMYIRIYLITIQNGLTEKHPLGTYIVQTPSSTFDGKVQSGSTDAYTPLLELKENPPPIGYSLYKDNNIMEMAYKLIREQTRVPVVETKSTDVLTADFVADTNDSWLSFTSDLVANAKYTLDLDELGRIFFAPKQNIASLQPIWTYTNDNSSILEPSLSIDRDLYGIPNVVEVIYSTNNNFYYAKVVNDDPNSPISTVNRGRVITYRDTNPSLFGTPTQEQVNEYAKQLLSDLSSLECTITYTHGYCPVRRGDCVRLDYDKAGLTNVKAKVISQNIKCKTGCSVTEKAVFTTKLWR